MYRLTAEFDFKVPELPGFLIASFSNNEQPGYKIEIRDYADNFTGQLHNYEVKITLISEGGPRIGNIANNDCASFINRMIIYVERQEDEEIPQDDFLKRSFFYCRVREFQKVAMEVLSRIVLFFKFKLHNPLLYYTQPEFLLVNFLVRRDLNPKWFKDDIEIQISEDIKNIYPKVYSSPNAGYLTARVGNIKRFTTDISNELIYDLSNPIQPQLYEELFSDAQAAAFHNNLRRAILELAISCEVFVKQYFFKKSSASKRKIDKKIVDLIDDVARCHFGESFKDNNEKDYRNIVHLFRCRNKIAHRGEIEFRDNQGILHKADYKMIEEWFESFLCLVAWLNNRK